MSADMRTKANKAIARELKLHGDITLLQLKVRDLTQRIRLARKMLLVAAGPIITGTTAWRLLDLRWKLGRKPLRSKGSGK